MRARIRPYVAADAAQVIALHERVLLDRTPPTPAVRDFVRRFYRTDLFEHPWAAPDLPSLVFEAADGHISAFLGIIPRAMVLGDRPIRVALISRLMADPDHADASLGAAGLFRKALRGPQDATFANVVNEAGGRMWEASRASLVPMGSITWSARTGTGDPQDGGAGGTASRAVDVPELLALVQQASRHHSLRPVYDDASMRWMIGHLEAAQHRGVLHRRVVPGPDGTTAGWYLYYTNPGGFNGVQQVGVLGARADLVLDDLLGHAARSGGAAETRGRWDPALAEALRRRGCPLTFGPRTYAVSRDGALMGALVSGDAYLTVIDGEF